MEVPHTANESSLLLLSSSSLDQLKNDSNNLLKSKLNIETLELKKREWTSKDGKIKTFFKLLGKCSQEDKILFAKSLNEIKESVEGFLSSEEKRIATETQKQKLKSEFFDLSLPGITSGVGSVHPITLCEQKLLEVARQYGFHHAIGPEIETDFFCFDALNVPVHHPARDLQDTFYTDTGHVLRTHCTAVSGRSASNAKSTYPLKSVSLGRAYRNEAEDASHTAMFHQFDLVWIDKGLTLAHLMGLISNILKEIYGKRRKIRFVRKFYPYTEPSIGPQIDCSECKGLGSESSNCQSCGGAGWITVAGAGVLHRNVMQLFNYDPDKVSGLAFGMGTSRLASQMFGFTDIRVPYENDIRVTKEIK